MDAEANVPVEGAKERRRHLSELRLGSTELWIRTCILDRAVEDIASRFVT